MESLQAFRSAITWSEPFILSIILFQAIMFALTVYVAKYNSNLGPRLGMMVLIAVIVKGSEYLNLYGSDNWESFCTQNYFDAQGVFMSVMVCAPLLVYSFIMLCFYLRETSQLLIQFKRMQLKQQRRNQSAAEAPLPSEGTSAHRLKKEL
jgi:transmembrane protein 18